LAPERAPVHDLVRAVAPPFPGAFTDVNGCRLALLETRVDEQPARYAANAPCLYAADDVWYADCVDGRRLKILQLAIDGGACRRSARPPALSQQPLALT
jgi:methionyl-tRNA formyltransferase